MLDAGYLIDRFCFSNAFVITSKFYVQAPPRILSIYFGDFCHLDIVLSKLVPIWIFDLLIIQNSLHFEDSLSGSMSGTAGSFNPAEDCTEVSCVS